MAPETFRREPRPVASAAGDTAAGASASPVAHEVTQALLLEYLASRAVTELVIVQVDRGTYRLEVSLSWRPGRSVLVAARGAPRAFRSLDTLARFLSTTGIGSTLVRLELKT